MSPPAVAAVLVVLVIGAAPADAQTRPAPTDPPSLTEARALYDAGALDQARDVLERLVHDGTRDPGVFLLLGVVERSAGRLDEAVAVLQQARTLAPQTASISVELATTLAWKGRLSEAIALHQQVLAADPGNVGARSGLGFALAWQGHLDEARAIFAVLTDDASETVDAWAGLGFVERASFRRAEAEVAYRRVLTLDPGNADAMAALEALRWDRRGDVRILGGLSSHPDGSPRGEGRIGAVHAATPRLTLLGAYQRYAYGAVTPISGGGTLVGTRTEDSLEAGVVYRPSSRTVLATSLYTFFSDSVNRGMVWIEGVRALAARISVIGNLRPAFSDTEPRWLMAGAVGAAITLASQHQMTVRALVAADTEYEPRLTLLANYDITWSRPLTVRLGAAHSSTDEAFEFTSVSAGATYLLNPAIGVSAEATHRVGTAERSTLLMGVILRR